MAEKLAGQDWRLLTLAHAADREPVVEVAHEQLLRRWPRLKSWLDEEHEFLVWKGQVEHAAWGYAALPDAERAAALLLPTGCHTEGVPDDSDDLISRLRAAEKPPVSLDPAHAAAQQRAKGPHEPWDVTLSQSGSIILTLLAVPLKAIRKLRTRS